MNSLFKNHDVVCYMCMILQPYMKNYHTLIYDYTIKALQATTP